MERSTFLAMVPAALFAGWLVAAGGCGTPEIVPASREPTRPNIILISIDTLRADHLSLYGYPRPTSPRIDALGRRFAVVFRNAVAQAPWTLPSHSSLLTGLDALRHGVNHSFRAAPESLTTLAERLREAGYFTAGITGGGWLSPQYGLAQGYDRFRYWTGAQQGDEEIEAQAALASRWLEELREPFFLFLHSYDVHDFKIPGRPEPPPSDDPRADLVARYDLAVTHMDEHLGAFLEAFEAAGLRGRTIVALTSDHGEDLGEDGVYGHGSLRDPVVLVPLVLELPDGQGAGSWIDDQVRSVDVVPTLLDLAGLPVPGGLDGVSLRGFVEGGSAAASPVASTYFSVAHGLSLRFRNRWKYTYDASAWTLPENREALYALPGGESPERDDLGPHHPQAAPLRALARRMFEERLGGLRVRFENMTRVPFTGRLRGDLIRAGVPKSIDLPEPWFQRDGDDVARFDLPPGKRFHLLFENPGEPRFEIKAPGAGGGAGRWFEVDLEAVTLPVTVRWTGSAWVIEDGAASLTGSAGLVLEERHGVGFGAGAPFEQDPELRRQLEALGYLN